MDTLAAYGGLFASAFLEATFFPVRSEIVLVGLLLTERFEWIGLLVVAGVGNTIGATINWALGFFIASLEQRAWFPFRRDRIDRAEAWYRRYGRWSLLLSWLPVIGDLLTLAAGTLREPLPVFLLIVGVAKTLRYVVVVGITLGWL